MDIVIVSATRTPVGSLSGSLSSLSAPQLGAIAIKSALDRAGVSADQIDEVIMGNVLSAGVGQAPARQASIFAGLPSNVACLTINKVCGSGLKAVMLAVQSIKAGDSEIVVAGGMESMSLSPHLLEKSRSGYRMGNFQATDSMIKDGLWDPYKNYHMGNAGEICVKKYEFTREEQDNFAIKSYEKALNSIKEGFFKAEITPVEIAGRKGEVKIVDTDEDPFKSDLAKIPSLKPAFDKNGTITAANAPGVNDGASATVIMSKEKADSLGLKPMAKIICSATHSQDPEWFTTAPVYAMKKALEKANLSVSDIDLFEINEAFSNVTMAAIKELELDNSKVNINGGAVALGHPIGASGARILTTLLYALKRTNKKYGMASLCIGGGEAVAMIVENLE
ncbi:MAG: acetyl-CoA C-acetyltransferase [Cyanobacteriota bacterium]